MAKQILENPNIWYLHLGIIRETKMLIVSHGLWAGHHQQLFNLGGDFHWPDSIFFWRRYLTCARLRLWTRQTSELITSRLWGSSGLPLTGAESRQQPPGPANQRRLKMGPARMQDHLQSYSLPNQIKSQLTSTESLPCPWLTRSCSQLTTNKNYRKL